MNFENISSAVHIRKGEFNFPIETSGAHQCGVESVRSIGRHQHFDITASIKSIKLKFYSKIKKNIQKKHDLANLVN